MSSTSISSSNNDEQQAAIQQMLEEQKLLRANYEHRVERDLYVKNFEQSQQKVKELTMEMASQRVEFQKKIQDLENRNQMLTKELMGQNMVKAAEQRAQMAENEVIKLKKTIKAKQKEEFCKEMANQRVEFQKKVHDLEHRMLTEVSVAQKTVKAAEQLAQMAKNELEATIRANQHQMEEFCKEMANLRVENRWLTQQQQQQDHHLEGKSKRPINNNNLTWNRWIHSSDVTISPDGLHVRMNQPLGRQRAHVFAEKAFLLLLGDGGGGHGNGGQTAAEEGSTIYYYETKHTSTGGGFDVGLSPNCTDFYPKCRRPDGVIIPVPVGRNANSYAIRYGTDQCYLSGVKHQLELPEAIKPRWHGGGNVIGCGILLLGPSRNKKIFLFFTLNGHLVGNQIPITPQADRLYPTVSLWNSSFATNFGEDPAQPFRYDVDKCPGLIFE